MAKTASLKVGEPIDVTPRVDRRMPAMVAGDGPRSSGFVLAAARLRFLGWPLRLARGHVDAPSKLAPCF